MIDNHQCNNESIDSKLKNVQCSAALAITGAIKETSRSNFKKN